MCDEQSGGGGKNKGKGSKEEGVLNSLACEGVIHQVGGGRGGGGDGAKIERKPKTEEEQLRSFVAATIGREESWERSISCMNSTLLR